MGSNESMGVPLVSSSAEGSNETIEPGKRALLVPRCKKDAWSM